MKKLVTCGIAVAGLIVTPAFAADMGVPAAPPPAPVYNWTGWYAGVNAGASFGDVKTDFHAADIRATDFLGFGIAIPGLAGFNTSNTESPSGFIGGGQIGYNWQYSPLIVVGLEADFQGALERDTNNLTNTFNLVLPLTPFGTSHVTGTTVTDYTTQIDWFGTVRGRIGYLWGNGAVMSYLTGGLAYGEVKINATNAISGTAGAVPFSVTNAIGHSQVNTGWTVGYGTEGRLATPGWTWKVEGLWMDLGTLDTTGVASAAIGPGGVSIAGGQVTTHTRFTDGILRAGLNYQFH